MFEEDAHFCRDFKRKGVDAGLFVLLFRESRNDLSVFIFFVLPPIHKKKWRVVHRHLPRMISSSIALPLVGAFRFASPQ